MTAGASSTLARQPRERVSPSTTKVPLGDSTFTVTSPGRHRVVSVTSSTALAVAPSGQP